MPEDAPALWAVIEAVLFTAGDPLPLSDLAAICEADEPTVHEALTGLQGAYRIARRGLQIVEVAGGYQLTTRPEYAAWVSRLHQLVREVRLTRAALETVAIIAYRQPLTRAEIEAIRGVDCAGVVRTLIERRVVKIAGRKAALGRPLLYGTTREFLQCFGLKDLSELPTLQEFQALAGPTGMVAPVETVAPSVQTVHAIETPVA